MVVNDRILLLLCYFKEHTEIGEINNKYNYSNNSIYATIYVSVSSMWVQLTNTSL